MAAWLASVFGWLAGLGAASVRRLARWVREALLSLWHHLERIGTLARQRFFNVLSSVNSLSISLGIWTARLLADIRDLYNRYVPRVVRNAVRDAIRWARNRIGDAVRNLSGLLDSWVRWLRDRINDVRAFARNVRDWAARRLAELRSFVNGAVRNLQHVLGGPRRLADWLIGAMVDALLRYVRRNETRIFRWARDRSLAFTLFAAGRLESLIRRLM